MRTRQLLIACFVGLVFIWIQSCSENPSEPMRGNVLDQENRETGGDPFGLRAEAGENSVTLNWNSLDATGLRFYRVYRRDGEAGDFLAIASVVPPSSSFVDLEVSCGTIYHYKVGAEGEDGAVSSISHLIATMVRSGASFRINNGSESTMTRNVVLNVRAAECDSIWIWNGDLADSNAGRWSTKSETEATFEWQLPPGAGTKVVNARFEYGDGSIEYLVDAIAPAELTPAITINDDALATNTMSVILTLDACGATEVMLSNEPEFDGSAWINCVDTVLWELTMGEGERTVYAIFRNDFLVEYERADTIILDQTPPDIGAMVLEPPPGAASVPNPISLSWAGAIDALSGIASYTVQIGTTFPPSTEIYQGADTSVFVGLLEQLSTYNWRVRTVDHAGNEAVSSSCFTIDNGEFVQLPAGQFQMGVNSQPGPTITLTTPFLMKATEVTYAEYAEVAQWAYDQGLCTADYRYIYDAVGSSGVRLLDMGFSSPLSFNNGQFSGGNNYPVTYVNWYGSAAYCNWISLREGLDPAYDHDTWECNGHNPYGATGYRLPTEAEWEYACRAGTQTAFNTGDCLDRSDANYQGSDPLHGCPSGTNSNAARPPRSYPPNAFGLYEMHGNIDEWCNDWTGGHPTIDSVDPVGPISGQGRVLRGGSFFDGASSCQSGAWWNGGNPISTNNYVQGFRVVRSVGR